MKKTPILLAFLFILSADTALYSQQSDGQPKSSIQEGEIVLQPVEKKDLPQESVFKHFTALPELLDHMAAGEISKVPELGEAAVLYLNGVYLFCSVRRGACPWILDAILETDIINSRINKAADCPQMRSFWKSWIKNDLQRKHDYQTQTAFMRETMQFRKSELPRYLTCSKTVTSELKLEDKKLNDAAYFKERYAGQSRPKLSAVEMKDFMEAIKTKRIDVFASVQMSVKSAAAPEPKGKGKAKAKKKRK